MISGSKLIGFLEGLLIVIIAGVREVTTEIITTIAIRITTRMGTTRVAVG